MKKMLLILVVMCFALTGVAQAATSWDMRADYVGVATPENIGPDAVWSYRYEDGLGAKPLMTWKAGANRYERDATNWDPCFGKDVNNTQLLHWHTRADGQQLAAIVRWTAPTNMSVAFTGLAVNLWWGISAGRIQDFGVTKNGTTSLYAGQLTDASYITQGNVLVNPVLFNGSASVLAGDYLEFWTYRNANSAAGFIAADWTISEVVPEPGSMVALGSGLMACLGFALRRRR